MKLPKIIGIYSSAPQCGKSSVAGWLVEEHNFARIPFAKVLKEMCRPLFAALGYSVIDIHHFETGDKTDFIQVGESEIGTACDGATVRHIYQTLGTDWGRKLISHDLWIAAWKRSVETALEQHHFAGVVADDLRFRNELVALRGIGGRMWSVHRPGTKRPNGHSSEGQLDEEDTDFMIQNDKTLEELITNLSQSWSDR